MGRKVLASIPERWSTRMGQLWPFVTAVLGNISLDFAYSYKSLYQKLNPLISAI
jgi:hypothetical protein